MLHYNARRIDIGVSYIMHQFLMRDGFGYSPNQAFVCDPIMWLMQQMHYRVRTSYVKPRVIDKSLIHLRPAIRNSYLIGFTIAADIVRKQSRRDFSRAFPSWNKIRSRRVYGTLSKEYTIPKMDGFALPVWTQPSNFMADTDMSIPHCSLLNLSGRAGRHMTFDQLKRFAKRLGEKYEGAQFSRPDTLGRESKATLSRVEVFEDSIEYVLTGLSGTYAPSSRSIKISAVKVFIMRSYTVGGSTVTNVVINGLQHAVGYYGDKVYALPFAESVFTNDSYVDDPWVHTVFAEQNFYSGILFKAFSIQNLRGALYHTQAKAMSAVLLDFDRNFENLVEASSFFDVFGDLLLDSSVKRLLTAPGLALFDRVRNLSDILSGATLAYNFAIKPTVDALNNLLQPLIAPVKGEGELAYSGASFSDLQISHMRTFMEQAVNTAVPGAKVVDFEFRFRSEVYVTPNVANVIQTLYNENMFLAGGIVPSPSAVWAASKASFIIDWFLPISRMLDDHTNYMLSFVVPFRIGHSVRCIITLDDGRTFDLFMRSEQSDYLLDPPEFSWLEAPGAPPIAIALAVKTMLGFL